MPQRKNDKELLADLLAKGYGKDVKRRRTDAAAAGQRRAVEPREKRAAAIGSGPELRRRAAVAGAPETGPSAERMEDTLGPLPPRLRRRIDRYAWGGGFVATSLGERLRSGLTVFAPKLEDWAGPALLRQLVGVPGGDPSDPAACSLLDGLQMLAAAARLLLGGGRSSGSAGGGAIRRPDESRTAGRIAASLRAREPFVVPFLSRLAETDGMAIRALEFARIAYRRGERVRARSLVRPVRCVYRLALSTDKLEADVVARLMASAAEVNRAHEVDAAGRRRVELAAAAAGVLLGRMRDYRHELFPVLLKCLAVFFPEESLWDRDHFALVCDFVGLGPDDLLDYHGFQERRRRGAAERPAALDRLGKEPAPAETATPAGGGGEGEPAAGGPPAAEETRGAGAPAPLGDATPAAAEEAARAPAPDPFAVRFGPVLQVLRELFPESGIHRLQQYHFVLPYFDLRVFSKDLSFPPAAQLLSRNDPMSQIMVLHRIIDNLISSLDTIALGKVLGATGAYREGLGDVVRHWKEVYTSLFDPYLKQLEDHARLSEVDRRNPAARRMEDTLNRLRNYTIRRFGRIISGAGRLEIAVAPLYSLAEQLAAECRQVDDLVNGRLIGEKNRQAVALLEALTARNVVDLEVSDYKPVIGRVKRLLEKRLGGLSDRSRIHLAFLQILSDVAALYEWLLNDDKSFYRTPPDGPAHAGVEERRRWAAARESTTRGGAEPRPLPVSATPESWAADAAGRFDALRKAGRLTLVLVEMVGRDVLEAEGDAGALAVAASAIPAAAAAAPASLTAIGRDRLLVVTPKSTRAVVGWVDRWRSQAAEALGRHPVLADVLEQKRVPDLGSLLAGVADCGDCGRPLEAYARVEAVLDAARKGAGPVAVWHEGEAIPLGDYLTRL